jgi:hypothetical protein
MCATAQIHHDAEMGADHSEYLGRSHGGTAHRFQALKGPWCHLPPRLR